MLVLSKTPEFYEMRFTNVELNSCLFLFLFIGKARSLVNIILVMVSQRYKLPQTVLNDFCFGLILTSLFPLESSRYF